MGKLSWVDVPAGQHLPGWGCHRHEATLRPRAGMGWCLPSWTPLTWGIVTGTVFSRYDNLEAEKPAREARSWGLVSPFPSIPGTPWSSTGGSKAPEEKAPVAHPEPPGRPRSQALVPVPRP